MEIALAVFKPSESADSVGQHVSLHEPPDLMFLVGGDALYLQVLREIMVKCKSDELLGTALVPLPMHDPERIARAFGCQHFLNSLQLLYSVT